MVGLFSRRSIITGAMYSILNPINLIKGKYNKLRNLIVLNIYNVKIGVDWKINGRIIIANAGEIVIGMKFYANSGRHFNPIGGDAILRMMVRNGGSLIIGNEVGISNSTIVCWDRVEIGDFVYIGGGCKIWDTDFHSIDPIERRHDGDKSVKTAPIKIGNYAFIGACSIILKGVAIGNNSIVGAGSVVTKSIPDNEIWAGNPARFIKSV